MWTLTEEELRSAKETLLRRREALESRYSEELKAIDLELAEIEELERVTRAFKEKHNKIAHHGDRRFTIEANKDNEIEFTKKLFKSVNSPENAPNWGEVKFPMA